MLKESGPTEPSCEWSQSSNKYVSNSDYQLRTMNTSDKSESLACYEPVVLLCPMFLEVDLPPTV